MWSSVLGTHGIVQEFKHRGALGDRILLLMFDHCHFQSRPKGCSPAVRLEEGRDAGSPFASWSLYSRGYSPSPPGCSSHSGQRPPSSLLGWSWLATLNLLYHWALLADMPSPLLKALRFVEPRFFFHFFLEHVFFQETQRHPLSILFSCLLLQKFSPFAENLLSSEPELCNNILLIRTKLKKKIFNSVLPTVYGSFWKEIVGSSDWYKMNCWGMSSPCCASVA